MDMDTIHFSFIKQNQIIDLLSIEHQTKSNY